MTLPPRLLFAATALFATMPFAATASAAEELLPPERPMPEVIDHYVAARLAAEGITPAPTVGDEALVRRTTLDLAGRIPFVAEVRAYVESTDPNKRANLVDRLLSGPDFELHQRNELEAMLVPDTADGRGGDDREFRDYLTAAARENRAWDRMFREMMLGGDGSESDPAKGAAGFLAKRSKSLDDMTNDVSRTFFGVSVNCAQCHDHPLVDDWKQDHYFGFQSFFSRTYLTKRKTLAERATGEVKFKTTAGEEKRAAFVFLTGDAVTEPAVERTKEELKAEEEEVKRQMKEDVPPPTPPAFSPRTEFVALALKPENRGFFSRSIVNRVWARLMGRGLIDPLDQLHSANPASHPELLAWLVRDAEAYGYDLRRLLRGIALSDAYARESRWTGEGNSPYEDKYATFIPRALTPKQYGLSLVVASKNPEEFAKQRSPEDAQKLRENLEREAEGYAREFEFPNSRFQVSVDEALFFSNGDRVQNDLLRDGGDRLVGFLKTLPDRGAQIEAAFRAILSRAPDADERAAFESYLAAREDRPVPALQQTVWALMTSPELRFNY